MKTERLTKSVTGAAFGRGLFIFAIALALAASALLCRLHPESRAESFLLGGLAGGIFLMGASFARRSGGSGASESPVLDGLSRAPVACALLDDAQRLLWANAPARQLLRIDANAGARRWDSLLKGPGRATPAKATQHEGVRLGVYQREGEAQAVQFQLVPLSVAVPGGVTSHSLLLMRDVSHTMAELREESDNGRLRAAACMATQIAHEVRNPVAAISGSAQLLGLLNDKARRGDARSIELLVDEQDALCRSIVEESSRLDQIISRFLSFSDLSEESLRTIMEMPEQLELERVTTPGLSTEAPLLAGAVSSNSKV